MGGGVRMMDLRIHGDTVRRRIIINKKCNLGDGKSLIL